MIESFIINPIRYLLISLYMQVVPVCNPLRVHLMVYNFNPLWCVIVLSLYWGCFRSCITCGFCQLKMKTWYINCEDIDQSTYCICSLDPNLLLILFCISVMKIYWYVAFQCRDKQDLFILSTERDKKWMNTIFEFRVF